MLSERTIICPVCGLLGAKMGGGFAGRWGEAKCSRCETLISFDTGMISASYLPENSATVVKPYWEAEDWEKIETKYKNLAAARKSAYFLEILLQSVEIVCGDEKFITEEAFNRLMEGNPDMPSMTLYLQGCINSLLTQRRNYMNLEKKVALYQIQQELFEQWNKR